MKKLLIGLGVLVVLVIGALIAAPFLIPVETYKTQIAQATRDATGRELTIGGDFGVSILPSLALEAGDVAFANAPGASTPQMATLKALRVKLQLWPLLAGEVKVDQFVLVEPVINLEVDKNGKANWDFGGGKAAEKSAEPSGTTAGGGESPVAGLKQLSLGDVRLVDGRVNYFDARSGAAYEISGINMTLSLPDLDSPFAADGSLAWNGETLKIDAGTGPLRGLLAGQPTKVQVALKSSPVNLGYQGQVTLAGPLKADGQADLDVPSIRKLAAWAGKPIEGGGKGLGPLKITGQVKVDGQSYAFSKAKIALDDMNASGDLRADLGGKVPYLKGGLEVDRIDLNTYMPPQEAKAGESGTAAGGGAGAGAGGGQPAEWSDEPIDVSGLKAANANFDLAVGAIQVQQIKIGRSEVKLALKDGLMTIDLAQLNLYSGVGKGRLTVDGRGKVPAIENAFAISGIQAEPLLTDAAGFDRLEGTGEMNISVTTRGASQRDMVKALNGKGAVKFLDGAIKGINLAAMVRNVSSAFLNSGAREEQKTDFAELSGTFTIKNGLLKNDDLLLLSPLLRLTGSGTSDLPARTVNYRVVPKAVASIQGQGGQAEQTGVAVPVIITGPWHDLKYQPDLAGMVTDIAKDPSKAVEGAKKLGEQLKEGGGIGDVLKGVTGGTSGDSPSGETQDGGGLVPDAEGTIKKLFGN